MYIMFWEKVHKPIISRLVLRLVAGRRSTCLPLVLLLPALMQRSLAFSGASMIPAPLDGGRPQTTTVAHPCYPGGTQGGPAWPLIKREIAIELCFERCCLLYLWYSLLSAIKSFSHLLCPKNLRDLITIIWSPSSSVSRSSRFLQLG